MVHRSYPSLSKGSGWMAMAFILAFLPACVERFYPDEMSLQQGVLVINAHITDQAGTQTVEVSRSGSIEIPGFQPEAGCYISLFREDGESREFFSSDKPGFYTAEIDSEFLLTGMQFQLQVIASDGNEYHSDYDKIRPVPAIDSIYYVVESGYTAGEEDPLTGIRFFIDFTNDEETCEYLRWETSETYEFHNPDMDAFLYPNRWTVRPLPPEMNPRICYITNPLASVHTLSTEDLNYGTFSKSFDFVPHDNTDQKLLYKYSLLVKQYSVGPEGFYYWRELGLNRQDKAQLFSRQPALLKSNICNIEDESEKVLGFFTMSSVQEIRAFAKDVPGLNKRPNPYYCLPVDSGPGSNRPTTFPAYFARATYDGETVYAAVNKHCVDCREYDGSSAIKPEYW